MNQPTRALLLFLSFALTLLAGCGGSSYSPHSSEPANPGPLSAGNLNLIFVPSEDLAYNAPGDINPTTANLTDQGLQRSLLMATFLQQKVLGAQNVTGIYALEPMTHLQTANNYPDMVGLETVQQFAMLNQVTLSSDANGGTPLCRTELSHQFVLCERASARWSGDAIANLWQLPGAGFQRSAG